MSDESIDRAKNDQLHEQLQETEKIIAAQQSEIKNQWTMIQKLQAQQKRMLACQIDMEEMLRCMVPQHLSSLAPFIEPPN